MGVFYCKDTLRLLANGDFWLSETPELPGSFVLGNHPAAAGALGSFETACVARFQMFNTHFPYRKVKQEAR